MFNCDSLLIDNIIDKSRPCLILAESEKYGLGFTLSCNDCSCEVCNTYVGETTDISSGLTRLLFGTWEPVNIKIVARIESIEGLNA